MAFKQSVRTALVCAAYRQGHPVRSLRSDLSLRYACPAARFGLQEAAMRDPSTMLASNFRSRTSRGVAGTPAPRYRRTGRLRLGQGSLEDRRGGRGVGDLFQS